MDYSFCILTNANIKLSLLKYLKTAFLKRSLIGCDVKLTYTQKKATWLSLTNMPTPRQCKCLVLVVVLMGKGAHSVRGIRIRARNPSLAQGSELELQDSGRFRPTAQQTWRRDWPKRGLRQTWLWRNEFKWKFTEKADMHNGDRDGIPLGSRWLGHIGTKYFRGTKLREAHLGCYLIILLASIVIEIITTFWENNLILRKLDLFWSLWPQIWPDQQMI